MQHFHKEILKTKVIIIAMKISQVRIKRKSEFVEERSSKLNYRLVITLKNKKIKMKRKWMESHKTVRIYQVFQSLCEIMVSKVGVGSGNKTQNNND